jgi:CRP-like cAMP-binding protein
MEMLSPTFVQSHIGSAIPERKPGRNFLCERFCRDFSRVCNIPVAELRDMLRGADQSQSCAPGHTIAARGAVIEHPKILLSGWAAQQVISGSGRRKIFSFHLPGDLMCVDRTARQGLPADIVAITPCVVLEAGGLANADRTRFPQLDHTFDNLARQQTVQLYQHVARLSSHTAYERLYSLLLELFHRAAAADLVHSGSIAFPLTQEVLADSLGLSFVHVNRTLQQMRRKGLVTLDAGRLAMQGTAIVHRFNNAQGAPAEIAAQ